METVKRLKVTLCTMLIVAGLQAQEIFVPSDSEGFVRVSYLVAAPGPKVYSSLGHAALRMQCPAYDLDYCFSCELPEVGWGAVGFFSGKLKLGFIHAPTSLYLKTYAAEGRGITEYELGLNTEEGRRLWKLLDERVADGLTTPCDYLNHGCAIECARLVDAVLCDRVLRYGSLPSSLDGTRREVVLHHLRNRPWTAFFWTFMAGDEADSDVPVEDRLIIPEDIGEAWSHAQLVDTEGVARPMVVRKQILSSHGGASAGRCSLSPMSVFGALFLLVTILTGLSLYCPRLSVVLCFMDVLLFVFQTAFGLFLAYLLCCSVQVATQWNWYAVPFNIVPLCVWLWGRFHPYGTVAQSRIYGAYAFVLWLFVCTIPFLLSACDWAWSLATASMAVRCTGRCLQYRKKKK